jgi:hypothetical protein
MGIKVPTFGIGLLWGVWQNWPITDAPRGGNSYMSRDLFDFAFDWIYAIVAVCGVISSLIGWWLLSAKKRRAESWPMVPARVERAEVEGTDTGYYADLSYSYQVNGEFFSGFYQKTFRMRRFAEEFVSITNGQQLFVRYHPEKPEDSVIRDQDNAALIALK